MNARALSLSVGLGVAAIAFALLAPVAEAGWLPPAAISEPGEAAGNPHVVLDSAGNATAVWDRWNGADTVVESAYRPAGEPWGAPIDLSESEPEAGAALGSQDAQSPQIVVDRNNDVTVLWERYAGNKILLQSVDRPAGGSWTAPEEIGEVALAAAPEPWIAVDWEGNETAVWKDGEVIQASFRPFLGGWGAAVPLSEGESFVPQAAMDARGDATAVWMHNDGSEYVVEAAYRPEAGSWQSATVVSEPGEEGGNPHVALDAKGDALVVWRGEDGGEEFVRASYRPVGGAWGAPVDVSVAGEQVQQLRDALDADGNAIVAWAGDDGQAAGYDVVKAAFRPVDGGWATPTALSADGGNGFPSDVVFDSGGNAAVVWERWDGITNLVQASYRPAGEDWESAVDLSEGGKQGTDAVVVLDSPGLHDVPGVETPTDGDATAVWVSGEDHPCVGKAGGCETDTVQAAGYDPGGAPTVELEAPETAIVGEEVEVSTPTTGLFAPTIEFGDGESVSGLQASHEYDAPGEYMVKAAGAEVLGYRSSAQSVITVLPGDGETETGPVQGSGPGTPTPSQGEPAADTPSFPPAVPPATASSPSASCAAAETARDASLRQIMLIAVRTRRPHGSGVARRLSQAKHRQLVILRRARREIADAC